MGRVADLVVELAENSGSRTILAIAAYPRWTATGELQKIGHAIDGALSALSELGGKIYRVMHAQGVVSMHGNPSEFPSVQKVCAQFATAEVELRAAIVEIVGRRDSAWLDALLGELSLRRQFGEFSRDPATWLVDGNFVPGERL